jgi:hypothetical protein
MTEEPISKEFCVDCKYAFVLATNRSIYLGVHGKGKAFPHVMYMDNFKRAFYYQSKNVPIVSI